MKTFKKETKGCCMNLISEEHNHYGGMRIPKKSSQKSPHYCHFSTTNLTL